MKVLVYAYAGSKCEVHKRLEVTALEANFTNECNSSMLGYQDALSEV